MFCDEREGNPFASLLVSREQAAIVGYVCYWVIFEELHIMNLAVTFTHRRRGVAKAMLTHTMTRACSQGAHAAMLEVRASNTSAIALYAHMGFQQIALRERYYSNPPEDAMIMRWISLDAGNAARMTSEPEASRVEDGGG